MLYTDDALWAVIYRDHKDDWGLFTGTFHTRRDAIDDYDECFEFQRYLKDRRAGKVKAVRVSISFVVV